MHRGVALGSDALHTHAVASGGAVSRHRRTKAAPLDTTNRIVTKTLPTHCDYISIINIHIIIREEYTIGLLISMWAVNITYKLSPGPGYFVSYYRLLLNWVSQGNFRYGDSTHEMCPLASVSLL